MNRDGFKCRLCNDEINQLNVHHLYYVAGKAVWEYDDDSLVTLCSQCHKSAHNDIAKISSLIAFNVICKKMNYFDVCDKLSLNL